MSGTDVTTEPEDPIAALMEVMSAEVLERINADFEDSMLLVGRVLAGRADATRVEATALDGGGIDLTITDPAGTHHDRIEFPARVTDVAVLSDELLGLVTEARERSGQSEMTTAEREAAELAHIRTFLTTVARVEDVHPHLRQVTFAGGDLTTFAPAGPDTFLYLLLPPPGRNELTIDQSFTWTEHAQMPVEEQPVGAYYTLRRWRPEVAELDIHMVMHDDAGPASAWAARVQPGDPVALWGPRTAYHPPAGTDRLVLVADETGLPAVTVILEQLPPGWRARVFAEIDRPEEQVELPAGPGIEVTWLHRDGAAPGTTTLLVDAVRALPPFEGVPYVWGGGESRGMTQVRRHVRDERGLAREAVSLVAYWRRAGNPVEDEDR